MLSGIASSGRPGPVLIDIPKEAILEGVSTDVEPEMDLPGYQPTTKPNYLQIRKLVEAVSGAKRPVILAGAGVLHAKASHLLKEYVEQQGIPVVHTLLGLGGFPAEHPLFIGMGVWLFCRKHSVIECTINQYRCHSTTIDKESSGSYSMQRWPISISTQQKENVPTKIPVIGSAAKH
jgi:acetolactate synthase-1/2/3 large subunit